MFVGYEIKTQQNQAKPMVLGTDIKLSQAVLDPSKGAKKDPVCLCVEYDKKQFIVAVLDPTRSWQCPLDLMFAAGSEVKFFLRGSGTVHLTGFEYRDDMDSEISFDTSDEEEEEEPVAAKASAPAALLKNSALKKKPKTNGVAKDAEVKNGKSPGKRPHSGDMQDSDDDDDDESDDADFDEESDVSMSDEDVDDDDDDLEDDDELELEDEESEEEDED